MTQVYAALWDGSHYLIVRKQTWNRWWGGSAAVVLVAEAAAAVVSANVKLPPANWQASLDLAQAAAKAAMSAWGDLKLGTAGNLALDMVNQALGATRVAAQDPSASPATAAQAAVAMGAAVRQVFMASRWVPPDPGPLLAAIDKAKDSAAPWAIAELAAQTLAVATLAEAQRQKDTFVNQAHQWALPGGRLFTLENQVVGARREFSEETGFDLPDTDFACDFQVTVGPTGHPWYQLARFKVPPTASLRDVAAQVNRNVAPRPDCPNRPDGIAVSDWELDLARVVTSDDLLAHLGIFQPLAPSAALPDRLSERSQQINWFAWMGLQLLNA